MMAPYTMGFGAPRMISDQDGQHHHHDTSTIITADVVGYTDHCQDPIKLIHLPNSTATATKTKACSFSMPKKRGATRKFPNQLYKMLQEASNSDSSFEDIVSWLPHGRSFMVHKPHKFTDEIMTRYFAQSKLSSFQRQLSLYGFSRVTSGKDKGSYYHELFLRGRPDLIPGLVRRRIKGTAAVAMNAANQEQPNFYAMAYCHDDDDDWKKHVNSTGTEDPKLMNHVVTITPTNEASSVEIVSDLEDNASASNRKNETDDGTVASSSSSSSSSSFNDASSEDWQPQYEDSYSSSFDEEEANYSSSKGTCIVAQDTSASLSSCQAETEAAARNIASSSTNAYNDEALMDFVQDLLVEEEEREKSATSLQHHQQPSSSNALVQMEESSQDHPLPSLDHQIGSSSSSSSGSRKHHCRQPGPLMAPGSLRDAFGRGIPSTCMHAVPKERGVSTVGSVVTFISMGGGSEPKLETQTKELTRYIVPLATTEISNELIFICWDDIDIAMPSSCSDDNVVDTHKSEPSLQAYHDHSCNGSRTATTI